MHLQLIRNFHIISDVSLQTSVSTRNSSNLFLHVAGLLEELGGASSAYWPNYPVYLPPDIMGFEGLVQTSGKHYSFKKGLSSIELEY
jgi:hypothetical protein